MLYSDSVPTSSRVCPSCLLWHTHKCSSHCMRVNVYVQKRADSFPNHLMINSLWSFTPNASACTSQEYGTHLYNLVTDGTDWVSKAIWAEIRRVSCCSYSGKPGWRRRIVPSRRNIMCQDLEERRTMVLQFHHLSNGDKRAGPTA